MFGLHLTTWGPWSVMVASVLAGCGPGIGSEVQVSSAEAILDAAQRSLGVDSASGLIQVFSDAAVVGPEGTFRTRIHSSSDGRVRMEQPHSGFVAGVGRSGGWRLVEGGMRVDSLGAGLIFVRGHELHMLALVPRSRFGALQNLGPVTFAGDSALAVGMSLPGGESLVAYFSVRDTVPVGVRVDWTTPPVVVEWSQWSNIAGLRLFERAVFRQGSEEFTYHYDSIRVGPLPDSIFDAPVAWSAEAPGV